jgi:cell division protein FtsN
VAQDFAKRKPTTRGAKRAPAKQAQARRHSGEAPRRGNGLRLYFSGVVTGVFLSFIGYLSMMPNAPDNANPETAAAEPAPAPEIPKPRFDFYTLLPEQTIDVEDVPATVDPAPDVSKPPTTPAAAESYVLQAGSFRQREDAERRRAELLLLGLEPTIEATDSDNGRWFRVYLGPYASHDAMSRARGLMANQNIDTLLLKRGG